jgi:hypothetical protein
VHYSRDVLRLADNAPLTLAAGATDGAVIAVRIGLSRRRH